MGRRLILLLAALAAALAAAGGASAFTRTDSTATMDDGVVLGTSLFLPDGTPPAAGWPGIMLFHGLGNYRKQVPWGTNVLAELWVAKGYAVLTFDARAHGDSGGLATIDGPRELADIRALFDQFAARPDVDERHIGAWGISYGGGATWLSAVSGIPFAAIETSETWTDLYSALFPQDLSKSGIVGGFLQEIPPGKLSPDYEYVRTDGIQSKELDKLRALSVPRSSLSRLSKLATPVFMMQGRRDFAFGLDQAKSAFALLRGPKRLYIGNHGHAPSAFPATDTAFMLDEGLLWFDRFLKGQPNGIDKRPPVEIAPEGGTGTTNVSYPALPPTKALSFPAAGSTSISAEGTAVRALGTTSTPLEAFGSAAVTVSATTAGGWPRLVAVLSAVTPAGKEIVVSAGGVPAAAGAKTYTIRMIDDATFIPKGSKLKLTFASSTAHTAAGLLYLDLPGPAAAKLTVGPATLTLPVLIKPVSK